MFILAHIGDTINEYRQLWRWYWPETCPGCGGDRFRRHTGYLHSVGDEPPVPILRFRCNEPGCRQVFTVLPDLLAPYQSQPVAGEERVVLQYAATLGTCSQVAQEAGVSTSTVWRWVDRAAGQVEPWVARIQRWLQDVTGAHAPARVDESLRPRWHRRRLRQEGKITRLLLLDRLPELVRRSRAAAEELLRHTGAGTANLVWPAGCLGFCRQVLPAVLPHTI